MSAIDYLNEHVQRLEGMWSSKLTTRAGVWTPQGVLMWQRRSDGWCVCIDDTPWDKNPLTTRVACAPYLRVLGAAAREMQDLNEKLTRDALASVQEFVVSGGGVE